MIENTQSKTQFPKRKIKSFLPALEMLTEQTTSYREGEDSKFSYFTSRNSGTRLTSDGNGKNKFEQMLS
jgi:hypothetical protein